MCCLHSLIFKETGTQFHTSLRAPVLLLFQSEQAPERLCVHFLY